MTFKPVSIDAISRMACAVMLLLFSLTLLVRAEHTDPPPDLWTVEFGATPTKVALGKWVECTAHLDGTVSGDQTVVLTNSDGRLRFDDSGTPVTELTLVLPADKSDVSFYVYGNSGSSSLGDAIIDAHSNTSGGDVKGSKGLSVFYFDSASLTMTDGDFYWKKSSGTSTNYAPGVNNDQTTMSMAGNATIHPTGIDTTGIYISYCQVVKSSGGATKYIATYSNPHVVSGSGPVTVPANFYDSFTLATDTPDNLDDADYQWLYDSSLLVAPGAVFSTSDAPYISDFTNFDYTVPGTSTVVP